VAGNKDIPRIKNPPSGDGHHVTYRYMTATELVERDARQKAYEAMLARQDAFERSRQVVAEKQRPTQAGCVFAKSCKLPDAIIDYSNPSGMVPTDSLKDYGDLILLGAREADASGAVPLKKISGTAIPAGLGSLALAGSAFAAVPVAAASAVAATLVGLVALVTQSSLGDSSLYTEDQLRALKQARTRVRLRVEQQADGSLKGYGFYTGSGVRPVYIVVSVRGKGTAEAGHTYHPAPETEDITAFPGLRRTKKKTPYAGGLRDRWTDAKGRTIYEWDFLHGELEAYRSSDGSHLGSFDYETGEQLDPPKKNRSIKKYL
jgi:hypothetical protein